MKNFTKMIVGSLRSRKVVIMRDSTRVNDLIYYLLNNSGFVKAEEIAAFLHVSKKTVYRLIKNINDGSKIPLISSQRGVGYKINYRHYMQFKQQNKIANNSLGNVSPVERRNRIMKQLLLISPQSIKESEAFGKYYVSSNVQSNDQHVMKSILKRYQINLVVKDGYIRVKGAELNIRNAIKELIDDREIVNLRQFIGNKDFDSKFDVRFVLKLIDKIEDQLQTSLPYPYNVNLFSHIYILISRLRKTESKFNLKAESPKQDIDSNHSLYQISKNVVNDISNYLNLKLQKNEVDSIFEYLISSRFDNDISKECISDEVSEITKELIDEVSKKMGRDFFSIQTSLEKHIQPLIKRLDNHIHVNNNLLEQIKIEYQDLFNIIKDVSKKVFISNNYGRPDDNEIGYITLYFAQALENQSAKLRVILMCATGIGTSELLRIKVKNTFPNFEVVGVTSNNDLSFQKGDADLIISTVRVSDKIPIPSVVVSALFTQKDKEIVQRKVDELQGEHDENK